MLESLPEACKVGGFGLKKSLGKCFCEPLMDGEKRLLRFIEELLTIEVF